MRRGLTILAAILASSCGTASQQAPPAISGQRPDVLFVTIDTLRPDRLGAYGYAAGDTPTLDRLAREGLLLEDALAQVPQTLPSHVSMLTGLLPFEHGVRDNFARGLKADVPTLATLFRDAGYATAAFIGALPVATHSGLDRGFDHFDDPFAGLSFSDTMRESERRGQQVVDAALAWLESAPRPYLGWVHLYDPHEPYDAPAPYGERFAGQPYDGEVAYTDAQLGRLVDWLERSGRRPGTLLVVTADHGEGLGDHDEDEHLLFVYDTTLRVPVLASWPEALPAGKRLAGQFRSIDLLPTLLELAGLPASRSSGQSRAQHWRQGESLPEAESYAESLFGQLHYGFAPLRALRAGGWKYIDAPRPELYHVAEDPAERDNQIERRGRLAMEMRDRLRRHDRDPAQPDLSLDGPRAGLLALGYVGGGGRVTGGEGADPKDFVEPYQAHVRSAREGLRLVGSGRFERAIEVLGALSGGRFQSFDVEYYLARSLFQLRRHAEAVTHYTRALELQPAFAPAHAELARSLQHLGRLQEADSVVGRGLELEPGSATLLAARGLLLQQQGNLPGALAAFRAAHQAEPGNPQASLAIAGVLSAQGQTEAAVSELERTLERAPRFAEGWNALGTLRAQAGRVEAAIAAFEAAARAAPGAPAYALNLATALLEAGRRAEAVKLLEALVERAPQYPGAREALALARQALPARARAAVATTAHLWLLRAPDEATALAARRRIAAGEPFASVARELSRDPSAASGGDLGELQIEDLAEPLRSAARRLAPGQLSAPVPTERGVVLLQRDPR